MFLDGQDLHHSVDRGRWCVTKADLVDFRRDVRNAVREGEIEPSERDPFDPEDGVIGPNMYTVNEQYIKPITRMAGNMSWALMLHPEGLDCDLFITHAWQEGIYEFMQKVLNSWPYAARNAYCCMLANPQNLGIADLICNPRDSPFAAALSTAQYVLVVPNHEVSVYMRLWCAYEAFLAYESDKVIFIARGSRLGETTKAAAMAMLAALGGTMVGLLRLFLTDWRGLHTWEKFCFWCSFALPFALSWVLEADCQRRTCHLGGAMLLAYFTTVADLSGATTDWHINDKDKLISIAITICVAYYVIAETDRVRKKVAREEQKQLTQGYTGCIQDADCSMAQDAVRIHREIGRRHAEVDRVIQLLIRAGVWTPRLRKASDAGVDIKDAARAELALPCTSWCLDLVAIGVLLEAYSSVLCKVIGFAIAALKLIWLLTLHSQPIDSRAFGIKAMSKLAVPWCILAVVVQGFGVYVVGVSEVSMNLLEIQAVLYLLLLCIGVTFTMLRIDRVAKIPGIGHAVAQLLVARGCKRSYGALRKIVHSDAGSDTDSDMESWNWGSDELTSDAESRPSEDGT